MKKRYASLGMLMIIMLMALFIVVIAIRFSDKKINKQIITRYDTGFAAGKAEAEKTAANEKKGRIYKVVEVKFPENYPRKGYISYITVTGVNVEEKDILIQEVQSSHVYDKTDVKFLEQFRSAKFVVIGEDGELIPLPSYILPQRIGS